MQFLERLGRRLMAFMSGRNGFDQLGFCTLIASLALQLIGSFTRSTLLFFLSTALYAVTVYRLFSKKLYTRQEENKKFMEVFGNVKTKARQYRLRLKNMKEFKYFHCSQCKALLRVKRGEGEKEICCPKCQNRFKIKS